MKTKELIEILKENDPDGNLEVLCNGNEIHFIEPSRSGYNVSCSVNKETHRLEITNQKLFVNIVAYKTDELIKEFPIEHITVDISNEIQSNDFISFIANISGFSIEDCKKFVIKKPKPIKVKSPMTAYDKTFKEANFYIKDYSYDAIKPYVAIPDDTVTVAIATNEP